nr:hypothetical protein [Tanacetum cinerariifolium]
MATTPSAGYTSDSPNPARPAPNSAVSGDGASHSSTRPRVSMLMQLMATLKPPKRLMALMNTSREMMKHRPKLVRHQAAP